MKILIALAVVSVIAIFLFRVMSANDTDGGFVSIDDFPELVTAIQKTGKDGAFWVVLIPGTALKDGLAANLQYSMENGVLGLDWVLIADRNISERKKFVQIVEKLGHRVDLKEGNGVQYLRVVEVKNMPELGQIVLKQLFGTDSSQKLNLIITNFKWKKKT